MASITQGFLLGGMRFGLDPRDMLDRAEVDVGIFEDPDALVPFEKHIHLARLIMAHRPRFNGGLQLAKHFVPKRYGLLGHVMQHGATLEQALSDLHRFQQLTSNVCVRSMSPVPEGIRLTVETHPTVRSHPEFHAMTGRHETPLAISLALGRHLTGQPIKPIRVSFRHEPAGDRSEHEEFFGAPVEFGMQADEMIFAKETLDTPLLQTNHVIYRRALDLVLAQVDPTANLRQTGAAVRQRLMQAMHLDVPKLSVVARNMGMSTRTLQRRLEAEGTSFESVVDGVRKDLTLQHLIDPKVSSYEIAGLVGFIEPSPFFRAFRRWFGCTPTEWRRRRKIL